MIQKQKSIVVKLSEFKNIRINSKVSLEDGMTNALNQINKKISEKKHQSCLKIINTKEYSILKPLYSFFIFIKADKYLKLTIMDIYGYNLNKISEFRGGEYE